VGKQGAAPTTLPANGSDYTANDIFGTGSALAAGEFVVYSGTGNSAIIRGLTAATTYNFRIYEYDGTGANTLYLTSAFGSVNGSTAATPTVQAGNIAASNVLGTSLSLTWQAGDGRARLVIGRKDVPVNVNSQDFMLYTANSDFGAGQQLGTGNYVLANTTDLFLSVHNLQPNSTYYFAVFEYNGFDQPLYLLPPAIFSVSTTGLVPVKLSAFTAVAADGKVRLSWETQSEINASHFNIQRSTDGTHFTNSGKVPARGNSQVTIQYITDDLSVPGGDVFYRLEIVDIDGRIEYSTVVKVSNRQQVGTMQIWDQSPGRLLAVKMPSQSVRLAARWRIIGAGGQVYNAGPITADNMEIDIQQLAPGMYWFQVMMKGKPQSAAFLKR
jgi:hypothetical protein